MKTRVVVLPSGRSVLQVKAWNDAVADPTDEAGYVWKSVAYLEGVGLLSVADELPCIVPKPD